MIFLIGATLPLIDLWRWWAFHHRDQKGYYEQRADWSAPYRGGIDFSVFVYRDRNRDGRLDLGDRPMAAVAVEMTDPHGHKTVQRSNLSGFTNFLMSVSQRKAVIRAPGRYSFRVIVPAGWTVTSGNATQSTTFEPRPGAPADLIARNPTLPIGLAPELFIAGRVVTRNAGGASVPAAHSALWATNPGGERIGVTLGDSATFKIPAAQGLWQLSAEETGTGKHVERKVLVRDVPVRVSAIVLGEQDREAVTQPAAARVTVDFESITGTPVAKIPSGVAGVNWNYLNAIEVVFAEAEGYANTVTSGHYVGYSSSGHPVTISRPEGFDFFGAYFGVALPQAEGETLQVQAFRAGKEVGGDEIPLSFLGPVWFDADYRDVDQVVLTTLHYWQFVTDDMVIGLREATPADVRPPAFAPVVTPSR
ncbi:MAG: hypothetical protein ACHQQS_06665 [Thermoanaerobaculales bacterium]